MLKKESKKYGTWDYFPKDNPNGIKEFFVYLNEKGDVKNWFNALSMHYEYMQKIKLFINMDYMKNFDLYD